jgi:hypothetical protein
MTTEAMTVHLPHSLYALFEERARQTHRTVEEELLETLAESATLSESRALDEMDEVIRGLDAMQDDTLWEVAQESRLSPTAAAHLEELNQKRQREGLTADEQQIAEALLHQYERAILIRAEALVRLKERGIDIRPLLVPITK